MKIEENIQKAVHILRQGGLVAIPTETVYGLAADAKNDGALKKIFQAKNRPSDHPLIVHISDLSELSHWAKDVSADALLLAKTFWPGPLTLILKKAAGVSELITGGQETIGIRMPNHPVAQAVLQAFGSGVAAPSANRFGRISPTTALAVQEELGDAVDLILEGGQCQVGVESTIVDMSSGTPRILRPGMITASHIETALHQALSQKKTNVQRVSGSMESHYAPETKTVLMSANEIKNFLQEKALDDSSIAILTLSGFVSTHQHIETVKMSNTAEHYAHDLYRILRDLDKKHFNMILIEEVPLAVEWDAIRDRLQRAASF